MDYSFKALRQKLTGPFAAFIVLQLFVVLPFISYCLTRNTLAHYYLGNSISRYIVLAIFLWVATSAIILMNGKPLAFLRLLLLGIVLFFYQRYFSGASFSILLAIVMILLVAPNIKQTFILNSVVIIACLFTLLYAVFGIRWETKKELTKPVNTILLVFDEFSLEQVGGYKLLEDKDRFPNFSALMESSDVYYNAVANDINTEIAVPSIMAGRYSNAVGGGFYGGVSLINQFRKSHRNQTIELVSSFNNQFKGNVWSRIEHLIRNYISSIYRKPRSNAISDLISISNRRDHFFTKRIEFFNPAIIHGKKGDTRPFFYCKHLLVPHRPYQWNERYFYNQNDIADKLFQDKEDKNNKSFINMMNFRERYIHQLERVDQELGGVLDKLKKAGVFDETVIILTSDHGISFNPNKNARTIQTGNQTPIQFVPLIVKNRLQTQRRNLFKPISNLAVHHLALEANGASTSWEGLKPGTGCREFQILRTTIAPKSEDIAIDAASYERRISREGLRFTKNPIPAILKRKVIASEIVPEKISDYVVIEPGAGNIDKILNDGYYPFNLVFSLHGDKTMGKTIVVCIDDKPCAALEINKKLEKYSIYFSQPFPSKATNLDFYRLEGNTLVYLPKKLGYNHFSSSRQSGNWQLLPPARKGTKSVTSLSNAVGYLAANHREIVFVDRKTENILQRSAYPANFQLDYIRLDKENFKLIGKDGQMITINYIP
jgi:hypothetical protein